MDQLRADVLLDLLEGHGDPIGRGVVNMIGTMETFTKVADDPGELNGYGPVAADIVRQISEHQQDTEWRWTLIDPDTGMPIDGGTTRRRPTTAQRRRTETMFPTCVHPGCRMPSIECDLDHCTPHAETRQTNTNDLYPLCRYHHNLKTKHGWTYQQLPNNNLQFTTPLGHTHQTNPNTTNTGPDP